MYGAREIGTRERRDCARTHRRGSYPGNVGAGHGRATVFVNVTTKLSAVPRLTRHSLKFHREIAPQARQATKGGEERVRVRETVSVCGRASFSHFAHCACPRFDNARLARRHESDPRRPFPVSLSLFIHFLSRSFSTVARSNGRGQTQTTTPELTIGCLNYPARVPRFLADIYTKFISRVKIPVHDISKYYMPQSPVLYLCESNLNVLCESRIKID